MTRIYGILHIEKSKVLLVGPKHESGVTIAKIVNDAANYWKHSDEWSLDKNPKGRKRIEDTFASIGLSIGTAYPFSEILMELTKPNSLSFSVVLMKLDLWRIEVEKIVA